MSSKLKIFLKLKVRKEMEKTKPVSTMVMSTLPDAGVSDCCVELASQ
jgi:hypothetical protein